MSTEVENLHEDVHCLKLSFTAAYKKVVKFVKGEVKVNSTAYAEKGLELITKLYEEMTRLDDALSDLSALVPEEEDSILDTLDRYDENIMRHQIYM